MDKESVFELLKQNYGYLFEDELLDEIMKHGRYREYEEGEVLIPYGQEIRYIPLMLDGAVKIFRLDKEGEELLLYYLESGDTCASTMTCCMRQTTSEIRAVAELDCKLLIVPHEKLAEWIQKYNGWMQYVISSNYSRVNELLEAIDIIAFGNMAERTYKYLRDKVLVTKETLLDLTHQEIAYDLHSSRVVVSRILKKLEQEGKIKLFRNKLEVLEF